jgi:hypothetical protein
MYFPSFFKILLALLALPFKSGALLAFSSAPLLLLHAEMRPLLFPPFAVPFRRSARRAAAGHWPAAGPRRLL